MLFMREFISLSSMPSASRSAIERPASFADITMRFPYPPPDMPCIWPAATWPKACAIPWIAFWLMPKEYKEPSHLLV